MVEHIGGVSDTTAAPDTFPFTGTEDSGSLNKFFQDVILYKTDGTTVKYIKQLVTTTNSASGSDGATARVLTLSNTATTEGPVSVIVGNTPLVETTDFTVSHKAASTTVTFVNALYNGQTLEVHYYE